MKEGSKISLSVLFAALLIGGALCVLAWSLWNLPVPSSPSSLYVTTDDGYKPYDIRRDFLSLAEASYYSGLSEDILSRLAAAGKLEGTYFMMDNGDLLFSRGKLKASLEALMENGVKLFE